jgi:hypothetical protein
MHAPKVQYVEPGQFVYQAVCIHGAPAEVAPLEQGVT